MKNLYFKSKGRYELLVSDVGYCGIESYIDDPVIQVVISQKLADIEFESYYGRMWEEPVGVFWYDFGSHTSFFVICDEDYIDDSAAKERRLFNNV